MSRKSKRKSKALSGLSAIKRRFGAEVSKRLEVTMKRLPIGTRGSVENAARLAARGDCKGAMHHLLDAATDKGIYAGRGENMPPRSDKALYVASDVLLQACSTAKAKRAEPRYDQL